MSGGRKRLWAPYLSFSDAFSETLGFVRRCEEKNLPLALSEPTLYRAQVMSGSWSMGQGQDLSLFLRFQASNDPGLDHARVALSRLLSVAVKAHYFLAENATVPHEPIVFSSPDLAHPGRWRYGVIYPIDIPQDRGPAQSRAIVVGEWDLALSAGQRPSVPRSDEFPVVLLPDPRSWLTKRKWEVLRGQADKQPWFEQASSPARTRLLKAVAAHTDLSSFPFGTLLDTPIELREDVASTGAIWARGVKRWFLPHGFDVEAVAAYLKRLVDLPEGERLRRRWWARREERREPAKNPSSETS